MTDNRAEAFLKNSLWSFALQAVNIFVAFIVPRFIIGCYGSEVNGLVSSLTQFVSYISLVEAGISAAAIYALYKPLAENDVDRVSVIVSAARKFYYTSGWLFAALIATLAFAYPLLVNTGGVSSIQVAILVVALGSMGILDFFTLAKYRVLLTASQRNWVIQVSTIAYKLTHALIVATLAKRGFSIEFVYIAAVIPIILRSVVLALYTKRVFYSVEFKKPCKGYKLEQRWDAFYLQVLGVVQSGAPIVVATFVLQDLTLVSVFSVYLLVSQGVQSICSSLSNGTQASFGDVIAKGQMDTLQRTFKEFQTASYVLNALVCGVAIVLVNPFVSLYTADIAEVNYVYPLFGYLSIINVFLYHLKTPQGLLVISAGRYRETRVQTTIQTLLLLIGSVVGGIYAGVPGILAACCLSNIYRVIDLTFYIPKNVTNTMPSDTVKSISVSILEMTLIMAPCYIFDFSINGWLSWLTLAILLVIWGLTICIACRILFEKEQMLGLASRLKRIIRVR